MGNSSSGSFATQDLSPSLKVVSTAQWVYQFELPYEILETIFSQWGSISSLRRSQFVCKSWYLVVNNAPIWQKLALKHGFDLNKLKVTSGNWQAHIFMASKIGSGKARKEKPLKAHGTRTSFLYSFGHFLVTVGSNEPLNSLENEWDLAAKATGVVSHASMKTSLTVWDTRTREKLKSFALDFQALPKVQLDRGQLFTATMSALQVWDFSTGKLVVRLVPPQPNAAITSFHVAEKAIYILAGREDSGVVYTWKRDDAYRYTGITDVTGGRYNWLDGVNDTLVLSSKSAIHFFNSTTGKKTNFTLGYQVFPSTAKVEGGRLFVEQGGENLSVFNVEQQTAGCTLFKSMRILQVNSNLRVHENFAFVTDMGKIRVFDLDSGVNVQTIEEPTSLYYLVSGLQVRGDLLIFAVVDAGIKVWNWRKKLLIATHPQKIYNSTFSQSGDLVLIDQCVYLSSIFHGSIDIWRFGATSHPYSRSSSSSSSGSGSGKELARIQPDQSPEPNNPMMADR